MGSCIFPWPVAGLPAAVFYCPAPVLVTLYCPAVAALHSTLYCTVYTALYSVHGTVHFTLYCTIYILQYSVHCTVIYCAVMYSAHCTLYTVHCTLPCDDCATLQYSPVCSRVYSSSWPTGVNRISSLTKNSGHKSPTAFHYCTALHYITQHIILYYI